MFIILVLDTCYQQIVGYLASDLQMTEYQLFNKV